MSVLFSVAIWIKTDVLWTKVLLGYVYIGAVSNGLISGLRIIQTKEGVAFLVILYSFILM